MADMEFTQQDIQNLTRKLATLDPYFSDRERDLLLAIFATAAERAKPYGSQHGGTLPQAVSSVPPPGHGAGTGQQASLPRLQQQLLSAYVPGNSFDSVTQGGLTGRITGTPGSITASPAAGSAETSLPKAASAEESPPPSGGKAL
jgi:hypothetical protein